ncbi:HAD family hydrolase [Lentzea sp. NEAU-D7]|uniref:HAD family hydrolase n=1 Tax=Lentzea sp. NEAU-D7 TaxID=2994667 RepID=UPI00224B6C73|nr:HAD-IA family hydrolase [Lentzea sp. NEAU-D7]MCX2952316.1 HAD-IA family hydrolase [Lentzea sp. NEAU-D7]
MTKSGVSPLVNPAALQRLTKKSNALFLDFDGPVCSVFAQFSPEIIAGNLRDVLRARGHRLPENLNNSSDPFDILRHSAKLGIVEANLIETELTACEIEAVSTAEPTVGTEKLMHAWTSRGGKLAIVSNNSRQAVQRYLERFDLVRYVGLIAARESSNPELLKPSSFLIKQALTRLNVSADTVIMVGDSVDDVLAAKQEQVEVIGYANKPGKDSILLKHGATAVVSSMATLTEYIHPVS